MLKFALPPKGEENAELVARRLKEATEGDGARETVTVEWNGRPLHVGVIDMPLRELYYNPATHRIRAQRDHDPVLARGLQEDPWTPESQDYLHRLLKGKPANPDETDPDFETLMESLRSVDQQEPGLITHAGILVNGNTRAAALRELKRSSIRVGVLPPSFTWDDINAVELTLQLRPDKRRDYSYINRLIAMEEQELMGRDAADIAKAFHIQLKTFKQERWILSVIRDMIERSATSEGAQLALSDFEGHQENLKELHRTFTKVAASSQENAERVKENRMAAIILDFAKTKTRVIGEDFQNNYLAESLPGLFAPNTMVEEEPSGIAIPGLAVSVTPPTDAVVRARAVTDQILRARATESSRHLPAEARVAAQRQISDARKGMRRALDAAERDDRLKRVRQTTAERLDDARAAIDQSVSDLVQALGSNSLDEASFDSALLGVRESLAKLARQASRGVATRGDGVTWLLKASED
ncbi:transcriptional regulator [Streptomyces roseicoloratus]|uniref:Transcriptional regulator n=1 Tax=Streptomyces roseicoloratus TaxID=2508722 RepID=A0ABY9RYS1_9ACTN|nr:transcriptional regulator [Streptomyces roseicoloratus]WMX46843.1 transcriptional regulator [Streptomyces roseicoloratus]